MNNPMMIRTNNNLIFCIVIERFNERVYMVRFYNIDPISCTNIFSTYLAAVIIKKFQGFSYCPVQFTNLYYLVHCSNCSIRVNSVVVNTGFIFLFILMNNCFSNYFSILLRNTFKQICIWILCCINSQIFSLGFRYSIKFS